MSSIEPVNAYGRMHRQLTSVRTGVHIAWCSMWGLLACMPARFYTIEMLATMFLCFLIGFMLIPVIMVLDTLDDFDRLGNGLPCKFELELKEQHDG